MQNELPKDGTSASLPELERTDIYKEAEQRRVLPRDVSSGMYRGQQSLGDNRLVLDSKNARILLRDEDGNPTHYLGFGPDDGRPIFAIVPAGMNVIELLGGTDDA